MKQKKTKYKHGGADLKENWQPSWKWNIKVLVIIYLVLIVLYILAKIIL